MAIRGYTISLVEEGSTISALHSDPVSTEEISDRARLELKYHPTCTRAKWYAVDWEDGAKQYSGEVTKGNDKCRKN